MLKPEFLYCFVDRFVFLRWPLVFLLLSQISCSSFQGLNDRRNLAEKDLDAICKKITVPNDFTETDSQKSLDIEKVVIFKHYKSGSSCNASGEHFRSYFIGEGWDPKQMRMKQSRGGMETLDFDFRNGDYLVSVECQNDVSLNADKKIVVSCSWGLR